MQMIMTKSRGEQYDVRLTFALPGLWGRVPFQPIPRTKPALGLADSGRLWADGGHVSVAAGNRDHGAIRQFEKKDLKGDFALRTATGLSEAKCTQFRLLCTSEGPVSNGLKLHRIQV